MTVVAGDDSGRVHFLRLEGMKKKKFLDSAPSDDSILLNNPVTLFYDGVILAKQEQYEAALPKLIEVAELRPNVAVVLFELGQVLYNLQRYEEAIANFDKAIEIEAKNRDFWFYRGLAFMKCGSQDAARASWDVAMNIQSNNYDIEAGNQDFWFYRGLAFMKCGSQDAARASWDIAVSIQPNNYDFWLKKGRELNHSESYEQAICCFDLALKLQPNEFHLVNLWDGRDLALLKAGRYEELISSCEKRLELKPNSEVYLNIIAYALRKLCRYKEAIDYHDKCLEIDASSSFNYYKKACCYALQSNVELALENLQRAIELEPERYRELAKTDADFDGIRGDVRFQELLLG